MGDDTETKHAETRRTMLRGNFPRRFQSSSESPKPLAQVPEHLQDPSFPGSRHELPDMRFSMPPNWAVSKIANSWRPASASVWVELGQALPSYSTANFPVSLYTFLGHWDKPIKILNFHFPPEQSPPG